ncbi:MAG: hypothetical protein ACYCXI_09910, partial [Dethiobacteraceae bacterium]
KKWDQQLKVLEPIFWQTVLSRVPHLTLPRGSQSPRSSRGCLFLAWREVRSHFTDSLEVGCLQWLIHLARLQAVTV